MRCDACGSGDSLFVVVSENSPGELRLCQSCALVRGYMIEEGGTSVPQLDSILGSLEEPAEIGAVCPDCGMDQAQLERSGLLGCSSCIRVFRRHYVLARKRNGLPTAYAGKVPRPCSEGQGWNLEPQPAPTQATSPEAADSREESRLLAEIQSAVQAENFEAAAVLRDRLGSLVSGERSGNAT